MQNKEGGQEGGNPPSSLIAGRARRDGRPVCLGSPAALFKTRANLLSANRTGMEKPLGSIDIGEKYFVGLLAEGAFAWFLGNWHEEFFLGSCSNQFMRRRAVSGYGEQSELACRPAACCEWPVAKGNRRSLDSACPPIALRSRGPKRAPLGMTLRWKENRKQKTGRQQTAGIRQRTQWTRRLPVRGVLLEDGPTRTL